MPPSCCISSHASNGHAQGTIAHARTHTVTVKPRWQRVRYVCGDLWLTAPVPERRGAEQRPARQTRRKRKQLVADSVESADRREAEWQEQVAEAKRCTEAFKREPEPTKDPALEQEKAPAFYNSSFVGPALIPGLGRVYSL